MGISVTNQSVAQESAHSRSISLSGRQTISVDAATGVLIVGIMAAFLFLLFRNTGLNPSIFGDEWSYSLNSRLTGVAAAPMSNYIYLSVFGVTRAFGSGFLECARILNSIFFVASAIFIYFTAQQVASKPVAVYVSLLSLCDPVNSYTAYYMPEAMYFFSFWLLTWIVIDFRHAPPKYYGTVIGCLIAVMTMIKVNAIFLLPGIVAFIVYYDIRCSVTPSFKRSVETLSYLLVTAAIVRLGVGYLFAGTAGLNVLGAKYGALAHSAITRETILQMSGQIVGILKGHIMGLTLLFGVPLASLAALDVRGSREPEGDSGLHVISAYLVMVIIPLLVAVAYFTASVVGTGPYESVARLHMRYYNFLFPLIVMVAAGQLYATSERRTVYVRVLAVLAVVGVTIYTLRSMLQAYTPNAADCPELQGVTADKAVFYALGALGITSAIIWAADKRMGSQLFLFLFVPAWVLCSASAINAELRQNLVPDVYARAGMVTHWVLSEQDRSKVVVVGSEVGGLVKTLFYIDNPGAYIHSIPQGTAFDRTVLENDRQWVLLMGDHALPPDIKTQIAEDGFKLFRLPKRGPGGASGSSEDVVDFSRPFMFGLVNEISGVSNVEEFGRWSNGAVVKIEMASPLPRVFELRLRANAFGPNTELPFSIQVGDEAKTFRVSSVPTDVYFSFNTSGTARVITISVPKPTSPKQLGISGDDRPLGIALRQMSILSNGTYSGATEIDFSGPFPSGAVNEVRGVSGPEPFGRWSDGAQVQLQMSSRLPRKFDLHLKANAFGPNTELPFSIQIGGETKTFRLSSEPTDVDFSFTTDGTDRLITINVPKPTSPKQLGINSDERTLGIALRQMSIRSNDSQVKGN